MSDEMITNTHPTTSPFDQIRQARVNLINRWGGDAYLMEAEADFVPVTYANERRKAARNRKRIARLQAQINALTTEVPF